MGTETALSVEDYLASSFDPDRDYVGGSTRERNVGEFDHSDLQTALAVFFRNHQKQLGLRALVEQRVQVKPDRFRIPDLCLIELGGPKEQVIHQPPALAIEILSPDDRTFDVQDKIDDYLGMGIPEVWVIDPRKNTAQIYNLLSLNTVKNGVLRFRGLEINLAILRQD